MKFKKGDIIRNTSFIYPAFMEMVHPGHLFIVLDITYLNMYVLSTPAPTWHKDYIDPNFELVEDPSELVVELLTPNRIE